MYKKAMLLWMFTLSWVVTSMNNATYNQSRPAQRSFVSTGSHLNVTFSFHQIKNPKWSPRKVSSTVVYAEGFLKHKRPMPARLRAAWDNLTVQDNLVPRQSIEARSNGQVISTSNGEFVFPVQIGTPKQTLNLIFDTGSGDFWVWSWLMPLYLLKGRNYYNGSLSSTSARFSCVAFWKESTDFSEGDGQSFGAAYGSGSTYGLVYQDTVWVDGVGVGGNPIECAQNVADFFASIPGVDGILGLSNAYNDSEVPVPQQTWLSYVLPNLASPVFSVSLVQNGIGTIDFGFINSSKYIGSIVYTPITIIPDSGGGFWAFNWTGFAIGTKAFNSTNIQVMTDTGGNVVQLPQSITLKYYAQVRGAYQQSDGSWCFPCTAALPDFTFGVGSAQIVVSGKHLILTLLADGKNCYGAIQATTENGYVYMTIPFMESFFLVHDYGGMRLGFANRTT